MKTFDRAQRFHRLPTILPLPAEEGVLRAESVHAVSPSGAVGDTVFYEDAASPATFLYLPRYRLRATQTSYDVRVVATDSGRWALHFGIEPYPAEELGEAARTSGRLPHTIPAARLDYLTPMVRSLPASEVVADAGGFTVAFDLDLAARDEVLWALRSDAGATLAVARSFTVAVPVNPLPVQPVVPYIFQVVDGGLTFADSAIIQPPDFKEEIFHRIEVEPVPPDGPPPELVQPPFAVVDAVAQPIVDAQIVAQPVFVEMAVAEPIVVEEAIAQPIALEQLMVQPQALQFDQPMVASVAAMPAAFAPMAHVDATAIQPVVAERQAFRSLKAAGLARGRGGFIDVVLDPIRHLPVEEVPPVVAPPADVRYRYVENALDSIIALRFDPAVHPQIFGGAAPASAPAYTRIPERFPANDPNGRLHVYFQDVRRPHIFLALPDEFRLARTQNPPFRPAIVFGVDQGAAKGEATVSLTCHLRPYTDPDRLEDAIERLSARVPVPPAGEATPEVSIEPVQAAAELTLGIPVGAQLVAPDLDLANGFLAKVEFSFAAFQDVFAALAAGDDVSTVLRGTVSVAAGGPSPELVPVDIRFGKTVGELFTIEDTPSGDRGLSVTVTNATESPLRIDALPVAIVDGDTVVEGQVEGLPPAIELAAGGATTFTVTLEGETTVGAEADVVADLSGVTTLPDAAAILALTLDTSVAQISARTVTVLTTAAKLGKPEDPERVETVIVEVDGAVGDPPQVSAATMKATVHAPVPLADQLLRRDDGGAYRFRQIVVRASGKTETETEWRSSTASVLVVPVV